MTTRKSQAWLVSVTSDDNVISALVFAESLRETGTTRRIGVISNSSVSRSARLVLMKAFDDNFLLDDILVPFSYDDDTRAKLFALTLEVYDKCIFLDVNSIILKNIDAWFQGQSENITDLMDPLILHPSVILFGYLVEQLGRLEGDEIMLANKFVSYFKKWIENNKPDSSKMIEDTDNKELPILIYSVGKGRIVTTGKQYLHCPALVRFTDVPHDHTKQIIRMNELRNLRDLPVLEKRIIEEWIQLAEKCKPSISCEQVLNRICSNESEPIAIVGMSCRFPGGNNLQEFWDLLYSGKDGIGEPPPNRWKKDNSILESLENNLKTKAGFLSVPINEFDAKFFGISPKEALLLDPQARILHEIVWESLENSGIDPLSLHGSKTGVFVGSWRTDYKDIVQETDEGDFFRTYMGNGIGTTAARLSFLLGLIGPNIATESGCSSAMVAVQMAVKSLRSGESNLALAGGVNLLVHPFKSDIAEYVIAPDGKCKTFDAKANGFGRAEGCGVLVLKRLSDARRDRDNICAVIRGIGMSQEGLSRSFGTPTVQSEATAMQMASKDAAVRPDQVTFVETHGTGTSVGDPLEVEATAMAYYSKARREPLIIGSVKTNVGHTESCSGITGIIKTVLAMQHEMIPKHLNLTTVNPDINLQAIPAIIPMENIPWPRLPGHARYAGVSSFGITGTDGHVILQDAPTNEVTQFQLGLERPLHLIKFSGKTGEALNEILTGYSNLFQKTPNENMANVAYTANVGRASFGHRAFVLARNFEEAAKLMHTGKVERAQLSELKSPKICFLFTGQGSQYNGMAKVLYETSPVFRTQFDMCNSILKETYKISILYDLWGNGKELRQTMYSQTSIFCIEYCLLKLWESWGIQPDYVLGHSLGEFCAAVAAGILTFEDALKLVAERSRLIDSLPTGCMLVIRAGQMKVEELLSKAAADLDIAATNSEEQTVIAGDTENILQFHGVCQYNQLKSIVLESSHAFHSRHMDPMLNEYKSIAQTINIDQQAHCKFISGVTGKCVENPSLEINAEYWVKHTREKVSFVEACKTLQNLDCQHFLEIGPNPILSTFLLSNTEESQITCYPSIRRNTNDWDTILTSLGRLYLQGFKVDWEGYDKPYIRKKIPFDLPLHPFHRKPFWIDCTEINVIPIHPLIGFALKIASSANIFRNKFSIKSAPYVKDHCLGNKIIMPGACFTEMCLAAGYCVANSMTENMEPPTRAMAIENMTVLAPFEVKSDQKYDLQIFVDLNIRNQSDGSNINFHGFRVRVYRQNNENREVNSDWLLHANAIFHPVVSTNEILAKLKPDKVKEIIQGSDSISTEGIYEKFDNAGLKFNQSFRSITRYWVCEGDDQTEHVVSEMKIPNDYVSYIFHPIIIDACMQSTFRTRAKQKYILKLPVRIGKLVWLGNILKGSSRLYLHAFWEEDICSVFALNEDFTPVAFLTDIEFVDTTIKTVESVLEQQRRTLPDSWEEIWKPIPNSSVQDYATQNENTSHSKKGLKWILIANEFDETLELLHQTLKGNGYEIKIIQILKSEKDLPKYDSALSVSEIGGMIYACGLDTKQNDQKYIARPFLHVVKAILNLKRPPPLYLLTKGVHRFSESQHCLNPSAATLFGMIKSLKNENPDLFVRYIDLDHSSDVKVAVDNILFEFSMEEEVTERHRTQVAYRDNVRYEPRFKRVTIAPNSIKDDLQLPRGTNRYNLVLPDSRLIRDLKFDVLEEEHLGDYQVEVTTKAYSLNFKDILTIIKPTKEFETMTAVGFDYAGIVTKVGKKVDADKVRLGDRVFGLTITPSQLPSHVITDADLVLKIPDKITYPEAASIPVVSLTAMYCLLNVAKLKKGETVLIHTGSGGVGLSAIQIAKYIGANIITTAGSTSKRAYLKSLGILHVFHSRNTSYREEIQRVTNGRVDVVLNSLTGPGFKEATLDICAENARFVEMSKIEIWSEDEVKNIRPDVKYTIVDMTTKGRKIYIELYKKLNLLLANGHFKPIPCVQFDALRIRQALQYFQKAKHIGKVVVTMPEIKVNPGHIIVKTSMFNAESTYVITGGLGGIGFEVCKWMLEKGATDIVLIGRRSPKPDILTEIEGLNKESNVTIKLGDIGNYDECKQIFMEISENVDAKPIRGIHHCAGVIWDNFYANQTWQAFETTLNPKVEGTWNLHKLTLNMTIEHFVLYSSMAGLVGTPTQSNHAAANCFQDAFVHYRHSLGLPATSINWGQWSQVGCAKQINVPGVRPVSVKRMINGLEAAMRDHKHRIAFGEFDSLNQWFMTAPNFKNYMDERLLKQLNDMDEPLHQTALNSDNIWQEIDAVNSKTEIVKILCSYLRTILHRALRMDSGDTIGDDDLLQELGVDSLMSIELKNNIQSLLGSRLTVTANMFKDSQTIRDMANIIVNKMFDTETEKGDLTTHTPADLANLLRCDCVLEETIQAHSPISLFPSKMESILITGVTGQLGQYVLTALSSAAYNRVKEIVCLVRTKKGECPQDKLKSVLKSMNQFDKVAWNKIKCYKGDVGLQNFGLERNQYESLSKSVHGIIHLAVKSNHVEEYRKFENGTSDLRRVNVGGTLNILRFASEGITKRVFHASSLLCAFGRKFHETVCDHWPDDTDISDLIESKSTGYTLSKVVGELLMKQANERGIPCKVFRFPWILGESKTGRLNYQSNHYILRLMSYLKVKAMPESPLPAVILPVDICAELSLKLFFHDIAPDEIYNIAHPYPQLEVEFAGIAEKHFGTVIKLVDWKDGEFLKTLSGINMPLETLKEFYDNVDRFNLFVDSKAFQSIQGYMKNPNTYFKNKKVEKFIPGYATNFPSTMEIIRVNLAYVKSEGFFAKFGFQIDT